MHVADAHQRRDVWFVRLRGEWVAEEHDGQDLPFGHRGTDLLIAAHGSGQQRGDLEARFLADQGACGARRDEIEVGQDRAVVFCKRNQVEFFSVVGDQRYSSFLGRHVEQDTRRSAGRQASASVLSTVGKFPG